MPKRIHRPLPLVLAVLAPLIAAGQTIELDSVQIDLEGASYTFPGQPPPSDPNRNSCAGHANILALDPTPAIVPPRGVYTPTVTYSGDNELLTCQWGDNVEETDDRFFHGKLARLLGGGANPLPVSGAEQALQCEQGNPPQLAPCRFDLVLPPRTGPEHVVVYTFSCTLTIPVSQELARTELEVCQDLNIRQSVKFAEDPTTGKKLVTPDPALPLPPGATPVFTASADWEDNIVPPPNALLRLSAFDSSENPLITPLVRGPRRVRPGTVDSKGTEELLLGGVTERVTVPDDGVVILRLELIEFYTDDAGMRQTRVSATAEDIVYQAGESLTIRNPRPPRSDPLFLGSATTIAAEVIYSFESVDMGEIVLQLLHPDGTELAGSPPQPVSKGSGSVPLEIPVFELFPEPFTPTVLLRAVLRDPSGAVILQSAAVEYTVEVLPCEVGPAALSPLSPKAEDTTSCKPDYTVLPIEAVQLLQDDDNSVPLVANRSTALRIYLAHDDEGKPRPDFETVPVDITLHHESSGEPIELGLPAKPKPGPLFPRRAREKDTERMAEITYLLPGNFTAEGELTVEVAVNRNKYSGIKVAPERLLDSEVDNNVRTKTFRFDKTAPVDIEYLILCDDVGGCANPNRLGVSSFSFRIAPIPDSRGLRYSPFDTVDVELPGRIVDGGPDFAGLLGRLAVFAAGRLVDYIVAWRNVPSGEGEIIENLGVELGALGLPRLFTLYPKTRKNHNEDPEPEDAAAVRGLLPVAHGIFPNARHGFCPPARFASPPSTIVFTFFRAFNKAYVLHTALHNRGDLYRSYVKKGTDFISSSTYRKLFNVKRLPPSRASAAKGAAPPASQDYFVITGAVEGNGGSLSSLLRASLPIPTPELPETGDVCVESQAGGATPARQCVRRSSAAGDTLPFLFLLPYDPAADRITLYVEDQAVDFRAASANPPMVAITAPAAGAVLNAADPFTLSWTANDADGDLLEFNVLYSSDGGGSWLPMAFDLTETSASFNLAHIAGGGNVFFRVLATDGFHTSEATVGPVNVAQQPKAEADATVDLGVMAPGVTLLGEVPIRSVGSGTLSVLSAESNNANFIPQGAYPLRIRAGSAAGLPVEFTPSGPGAASTMLTVQTDDPDTPSLTVEVEATVRDPSEPILGPLEDSGLLEGFAGVGFGNAVVGDESVAAVTVINYGEPDLTVEPAIAGEGFRLLEEEVPALQVGKAVTAVPSGAQSDILVAFSPPGAGDFAGTLTLTTNDPQRAQVEIPLSGTGLEAANRPTINPGGVADAASFGPTVVPGGIAALFGVELADGLEAAPDTPLPLELQGAGAFVDGWAAPLFFVSAGQINFQVPYEVGPGGTASVVVRRNGVDSVAESVAVADYAPGLFVFTGEPIVVRFADGSLITADNPARPGDVLILYLNGVGDVANPPPTGAVALASPLSVSNVAPTVTVGGAPAQVFFAGLTPGLVALVQMNIQLPDVLPPGDSLELIVDFDGSASQPVNLPVASP